MYPKQVVVFSFLALISNFVFGGHEVDSLKNLLSGDLHDTVRIELMLDLSDAFKDEGFYEEGIQAGNDVVELAGRTIGENKFPEYARNARLKAYQVIGFNLEKTNHFADAVLNYETALQIAVKENNLEFQCKLLGNLGMYYYNVGDYPLALEHSLRQLKLAQYLKDKRRMASAYNRIGITYKRQMMHDEALLNLTKSVELYEELGEMNLLANGYNNIGNVYFNMKNYRLAYENYKKEKEIGIESKDPVLVADADNCTAQIFNEVVLFSVDSMIAIFYDADQIKIKLTSNDILDSAEFYFMQAIHTYDSLHAYYELADCYNGLGNTYTLKDNYTKAIETFHKGYELAKMNGILQKEMTASFGLFEGYRKLNKFQESLLWYENYNVLKDSVFSDSKSRELGRLQVEHEYEVKEAQLAAERANERLLADSEKHKQKVILWVVSVGLGIVFLLLIFLFTRFRLIQKQKRTIEHHKAEVETKQKEIVDSISYAKRLQQAILAKEESIVQFFPQSFLMYKPKDIVAGDFYFFETTETHIFYAAADCTGHGVPGALMSIVCSNALARSIKEFGLTEPGKILDKTRDLVVETFDKSGADVKDGMDISLISKNRQTNEIQWSGAQNPLWIIEKNTIVEIKGDKQPIGKSEHVLPFKSHTLKTGLDAMLVLLTDGFADQFGGEKGKKFKYSALKELLLSISEKPMEEQKSILSKTFENWRGNLEQVDDVCVVGVRV